jgi:hypothetical protein
LTAGACGSKSSGTPGTAGTNGGAGTGGGAGTAGGAGAGTGGASGAGGAAGKAGAGGAAGNAGAGGALAMPTELVSAMGCGNLRLVLSGGKIYYTNNTAGTVSSVAVTGGTPTPIATMQNKPNAIAVDGTSVYWGNDGDRTVTKQALTNGTAMPFIPAPADTDPKNVVNALLVSGTTLYVGRGLDTYKMATSGGMMTQLSHSLENGSPGALATDATHLFQPEIDHNAITRETLDGMQSGAITDGSVHALAPDRLAVSRSNLVTDAIEISGQYVVWANGSGIEAHDKDTTEQQKTYVLIANSAEFSTLSGFIITGDKIYMGEADSSEVEVVGLNLMPGDAGAPAATVIATKQPNPAEFAADDTNIYYTTITKRDASGVCKIMKLAK